MARNCSLKGKQMSKSIGTHFNAARFDGQGFQWPRNSLSIASAHYRETFKLTLGGLRGEARASLMRNAECMPKLREIAAKTSAPQRQRFARDFPACSMRI